MQWKPISCAPQDGTKIWAWLYDKGIVLVHFMTAEQSALEDGGDPNDYMACWVLSNEPSDDYHPKFWLPFDAIPTPPGVIMVHDDPRIMWRDATKAA